jgi:hypothetical protein
VPKSLGGAAGQVISLTFREHFLAHWLLTKIVTGPARRKMQYALGCMSRGGKWHDRVVTSRQAETARNAWRAASAGRRVSEETRQRMRIAALSRGEEYSARMSQSQTGRKLSDATKAKLSAFMKTLDPAVRERMDAPRRGRTGRKVSEATRQKMIEAAHARHARQA